MNGSNRLLGLYLRHYNKLFWALFALAGVLFMLSVSLGYPFLDLVLGLALVIAGLGRLGQELVNRRSRRIRDDSIRTINELLQWAEKSYDYTRAFKETHEKRLFRLDSRHAELRKKAEEDFRSAVKKVIELENRLNRALKGLEGEPVTVDTKTRVTRRPRPREARLEDLTDVQSKALQLIRRKGRITNREYREAFKVSDKKAYNELQGLARMGLIRRKGRGRSTHYVLAF